MQQHAGVELNLSAHVCSKATHQNTALQASHTMGRKSVWIKHTDTSFQTSLTACLVIITLLQVLQGVRYSTQCATNNNSTADFLFNQKRRLRRLYYVVPGHVQDT